jgi:predicted metal-dependent phosphoesterase TrpH
MTKKFADLHVHTNASDGDFSPEEIVKQAKEIGLAAIGIADHDTIEGIDKAVEAGKKYGVEVIPGVELSSEFEQYEVHILGYFIDWHDRELDGELQKFKEARKVRAEEILKKLRKLGINISYKEVAAIAGDGVIGRPHIAEALAKRGYVRTKDAAFAKYLAYGCPAYVPKYRLPPEKAINIIHQAGGVAILAHPVFGQANSLLPDLIKSGLDGIEVYHSKHDSTTTEYYAKIAKELNLLVTGGTDCHDADSPLGAVKIPYELVEEMKARHKLLLSKKSACIERNHGRV